MLWALFAVFAENIISSLPKKPQRKQWNRFPIHNVFCWFFSPYFSLICILCLSQGAYITHRTYWRDLQFTYRLPSKLLLSSFINNVLCFPFMIHISFVDFAESTFGGEKKKHVKTKWKKFICKWWCITLLSKKKLSICKFSSYVNLVICTRGRFRLNKSMTVK